MTSSSAAAILAGGKASRLGGNAKGLLEIAGKPIIEHELGVLCGLFTEIFIVANDPEPYQAFGLPIVADSWRNCGPLAGLEAALSYARAERVFVCGCDMPGLCRKAISLTLEENPLADVVVPVVAGRPEPLHACYRKTCLPAIRHCLAQGQYKMTAFFAAVRVCEIDDARLRTVDSTLRCVYSINTPSDLDDWVLYLRAGRTTTSSADLSTPSGWRTEVGEV